MAGLKVRFLAPVRYGLGEELKDFAIGDVYEFPTSEKANVMELIENGHAEKASGPDKESEETPST